VSSFCQHVAFSTKPGEAETVQCTVARERKGGGKNTLKRASPLAKVMVLIGWPMLVTVNSSPGDTCCPLMVAVPAGGLPVKPHLPLPWLLLYAFAFYTQIIVRCPRE
jgi:hypothetical protein